MEKILIVIESPFLDNYNFVFNMLPIFYNVKFHLENNRIKFIDNETCSFGKSKFIFSLIEDNYYSIEN